MSRVQVLDHGYVEMVERWGSDERIIEAARMSTDKGFLGWGPRLSGVKEPCGEHQETQCLRCDDSGVVERFVPGDEKLLRFLWENEHHTPFEMAGATFEVQAPIFVFREWHRHRASSINELSARYTPLPDVNYMPTVERLVAGGDGKNRQAGTIKTAGLLMATDAEWFQTALFRFYGQAERLYQDALKAGVPKELARVCIPVGRYSRMRVQCNLRMWVHFLSLRMAPNAQHEIRQFASAVHDELALKFPRTLALFDEGRKS